MTDEMRIYVVGLVKPTYITVRDKFYSPNNRPKVAGKAANYPSPSGEVAVVAEGRGVQMRVRVEQK